MLNFTNATKKPTNLSLNSKVLEMAREIIARQTPAEGGNGASKIVVPQFLPPKLVP